MRTTASTCTSTQTARSPECRLDLFPGQRLQLIDLLYRADQALAAELHRKEIGTNGSETAEKHLRMLRSRRAAAAVLIEQLRESGTRLRVWHADEDRKEEENTDDPR